MNTYLEKRKKLTSGLSERNNRHSILEKASMFAFIVSLGLGEVITVGPIKLSYLTTILVATVYLARHRFKLTVSWGTYHYKKLLNFCAVWMLYALIQRIWAQDANLYNAFLRTLLINIIVIVFITLYTHDREDWLLILQAFITLIGISLLVGFWEMMTGSHVVALEGQGNLLYYRFRPIAFYGNGNDYATVLAFGIFAVFLHFLIVRKTIFLFIFDMGILIASVIQIIVINARGALYSIYLIVLLMLVLSLATYWSRNSQIRTHVINIFLVLFSILLLFGIFSAYSPEALIERFSGAGNYRSDLGRLQMIRNGLIAFVKSLGFGVGPGQSILANNTNLHNFYLEILVEYGIFVGGYLLNLFFRMSFWVAPDLDSLPKLLENALIRSFPITVILLGVSSSGMLRLRPTWVFFTLLYIYVCRNNGSEVRYLDTV